MEGITQNIKRYKVQETQLQLQKLPTSVIWKDPGSYFEDLFLNSTQHDYNGTNYCTFLQKKDNTSLENI